ncbi:unnamed protein product [Clavelina lepadiformis]|uniref:protein-tyrosine-phosphatase n=1 Tax=Clavelina lepadiformis TaxID=159417 RepID=A0ABP0FPK0_CLALP
MFWKYRMECPLCSVACIVLATLIRFTPVHAECPSSWQVIDNNLFILSDHQNTSIEAENQCSTNGGFLATVDEVEVFDAIINKMSEKYTKDLQRIYVSYQDNYRYSTGDGLGSYWIRDYNFPYFNLYTKPTDVYTTPIYFCRALVSPVNRNKWLISKIPCNVGSGFNEDFMRYGGAERSPGVQKIFRHGNEAWSTRLSPISNVVQPYNVALAPIFIPDINVFIGARSDIGESGWFWSNGSLVTDDSNFPSANPDICQQIAYHYTDNQAWSKISTNCGSSSGYYVCQIKLEIKNRPVSCDGTSLTVTWEPKLFSGVFQTLNQLEFTFIGESFTTTSFSNFSTGSITIGNLKQRSDYSIKATLSADDCPSFQLTSKAISATTGYGLPGPVTTAFVKNQTGQASPECVVEWIHESLDFNILHYKINISSNASSTSVTFSNISQSNFPTEQRLMVVVPLDLHGHNLTVNMTIQTYSCAGAGPSSIVSGFCVSPLLPPPQTTPPPPQSSTQMPTEIVVGIMIGVVAFVVVVLTFGYLLHNKKNRNLTKKFVKSYSRDDLRDQSQSNSNESQNESHVDISEVASTKESLKVSTSTALDKLTEESVYVNTAGYAETEITAVDLEKIYSTKCANNYAGFYEEFKIIQQQSPILPHESSQTKQNAKKNRYKNVYSNDNSRVILRGSSEGDYINASYIESFQKGRRFIATQGPKNNTIEDFWTMVWEQNVSIIVMLCRTMEHDKVKYATYWPEPGKKNTHGQFEISTTNEENLGDIKRRTIFILNRSILKNRTVTQFQLLSWPDHGIPLTTSDMIYLRRMVKETWQKQATGPIVVHCSAGAGRSGTFIAMDNLCSELEQRGKIDVAGEVLRMRGNRMDMVQTLPQYVFIHKLLLESYMLPGSDVLAPEFTELISKDNWNEKVSKEFKRLQYLHTISPAGSYTSKVLFMDKNKPPEFLNAYYVKIFGYSGNCIASKSAPVGGEEEFLKLLVENNVRTVIEINDKVNQLSQDSATLGDFCITIDATKVHDGFVEKFLTISSAQSFFPAYKASFISLQNWNDEAVPPNLKTFLDVIQAAQTFCQGHTCSGVLVCCSNGHTRTGTFIAISNLVERLKSENRIDVFRTVKDLRDICPNMVNSLELYKFCYSFVKEYLESFATYSNFT